MTGVKQAYQIFNHQIVYDTIHRCTTPLKPMDIGSETTPHTPSCFGKYPCMKIMYIAFMKYL
jgi:hypothetical protein